MYIPLFLLIDNLKQCYVVQSEYESNEQDSLIILAVPSAIWPMVSERFLIISPVYINSDTRDKKSNYCLA